MPTDKIREVVPTVESVVAGSADEIKYGSACTEYAVASVPASTVSEVASVRASTGSAAATVRAC